MFDQCFCLDVDDPVTLLSRKRKTARKTHKCGECGWDIKPGQEYEVDATVFEGNFEAHKICIPCLRVRRSLFKCGWYYGGLWEYIHDAICDYDEGCVCPEAAVAKEVSDAE